MLPQTLSLAETFRILGVSNRTGRAAVENGQLKTIRLAERRRVPRAELDRLLRAGAELELQPGRAMALPGHAPRGGPPK